jgi:hypothetical protein
MIPYDDLVVALAGWRARQGLPVEQLAAPITATAPAPVATTRPPAPPPPRGFTTRPPPLAPPDHDEFAVEDSALIEEGHLDNEGEDFEMGFRQLQGDENEATSIGASPTRESFGGSTQPEPAAPPASKRRNNDDW